MNITQQKTEGGTVPVLIFMPFSFDGFTIGHPEHEYGLDDSRIVCAERDTVAVRLWNAPGSWTTGRYCIHKCAGGRYAVIDTRTNENLFSSSERGAEFRCFAKILGRIESAAAT